MSRPGCSCKSANEPNPNCAYCGNKNKQQGYYNDSYQGGYGYGATQPQAHVSYNKPGCCCKSANEPSPNCAYCGNKNKQAYYDDQYNQYNQGSEYSYGSQKSQPYSQHSAASAAVNSNTSSWALLRPVLVFGLGSFLTSKMVTVASELG